ncbi:MAG: hypothetical protein ABR510_01855 [Trueperaceae bacterium]
MDQPALWLVALNAFAAVVVLLAVLAGAIRLLSVVFPERAVPARASGATRANDATATLDAATLAAIQVAVQRALPGGRVVRVERTPGGPK